MRAAFHLCATFPRAREGDPSASGFDPAAPARSYGDCSARADRNRWPRGGCGVCALWHFRLGDRRSCHPWACGRPTARGQFLVAGPLADSEARRRFLFWTWRSAVAARRPPLAASGRSAFGYAPRSVVDLGIGRSDRSLNLHLKGGRVLPLRPVSSRARGRRLGQGFDPAAPARSYGDCSARADRNR